MFDMLENRLLLKSNMEKLAPVSRLYDKYEDKTSSYVA